LFADGVVVVAGVGGGGVVVLGWFLYVVVGFGSGLLIHNLFNAIDRQLRPVYVSQPGDFIPRLNSS
jgi:hypothetical protein